MKKYFFLIRRSLLWSVPCGIMMVLINYFLIHKNDFSFLDIILPLLTFVFIAGPIYGYLISSREKRINGKKSDLNI